MVFRATWRKTCERAGVKGLTFHDLRGTAVSRLAIVGATEMEIAAIPGHAVSDVRSIMDKFYFNRDPAMAVSAVRKLEKGTKSANRPANQPE
jgi:integrase